MHLQLTAAHRVPVWVGLIFILRISKNYITQDVYIKNFHSSNMQIIIKYETEHLHDSQNFYFIN